MSLVVHQLRKDARQFRVFLAVFLGLILLDLAVNLGWIGRVVYSPNHGFDTGSDTWTSMLPGVIWVLVGLVPSLVVLADSPARRDGFLATRPLPKMDLLLAKVFFVAGLIVAPWVLQEGIHLVTQGMPAWLVWRGTLERLLYALPVAFMCAGFAALWSDPARWARALSILLGIWASVGVVGSLAVYYFNWVQPNYEANKAHGLVMLYSLALAVVGVALWHSRAAHGPMARWTVFLAAIVIVPWVISKEPWDCFVLQPSAPDRARETMANSGFQIPDRAIRVQKVSESGQTDRPSGPNVYKINVAPKTLRVPAGVLVGWSVGKVEMKTVTGGNLCAAGDLYPTPLFDGNAWANFYNDNDMAAWAPEFPESILFRVSTVQNGEGGIDLGDYSFATNSAAWTTQPVTLQASLEARVYQWEKIADLPLTPGAASTDEFGSWKFVAAKLDHPTIKELYIERRQINLITAGDSRCSSVVQGPLSRMAWMIYDPVHRVATLPDQHYYDSTKRGGATALTDYFIKLSFFSGQIISSNVDSCRLVIFEKTWVGSEPEPWKSGAFTLADKLNRHQPPFGVNAERLPEAEFQQRVAALKLPAPDAPRREVAVYLLDLLELVNAHRVALATNDVLTARLAGFVPAHLDLLVDGLPTMTGVSGATVINAIILGATDQQKTAVIAALPNNPELAEVLLARGWVKEAAPALEQLARSPEWIPTEAVRAMAALHDAGMYPRLLTQFDDMPTLGDYQVLHAIPELAPKVDEMVARHWRAESLVWRDPDARWNSIFEVALCSGNRAALERVYQVLDDPVFEESSVQFQTMAGSLRRMVRMPGLNTRNRGDEILEWMRRHRPEDFVFNPALQKFVLKEKP